jgi:DNA (cytosine-5)-methyltransferase 1
MLNGLDLFSGIAGNTLALREWVRTVAYCENDRHAQAVLLSRMADLSIEPAPIWDDITTLNRSLFDVPVDIIVGGFPCQDISVAGKGAGLAGERSGLVFEIFRLITELSPTFVFLENVPAIRTRGGQRVVQELAGLGYDCRWDVLSAFDVGAPHKRNRWFLLAYRNSDRLQGEPQSDSQEPERYRESLRCHTDRLCDALPDTGSLELRDEQGRVGGASGASEAVFKHPGWWVTEPDVGRVASRVPLRAHRLKRLGNSVVPAQAREAFRRLMGITNA